MNKNERRDARVRQWIAPCMAGVLGVAQAAPETSPLTEQDFFSEVPVVLSVSRLSQPVSEAPSAVTVIDREMIQASGFRELADVLRFVPGFYVGYANGNEPVVSHGLTNRYFGRVQVLVDGRSVYTPMFGQVQWALLPVAIEDVERIEVTRGPNAASYGANSFLGIINIITQHPAQNDGTLVSLSGGDPGRNGALVRHAGKAGGWEYRITAGHKEDTGFAARSDSQRINQVSVRGDYRLDGTDSLQVQAGYAGGTVGEGYVGNDIDVPRDRATASGFTQLRWQRTYAADDELTVQFYHAFNQNREQADVVPTSTILPTILRLEQDSQRFDLEIQRTQGLAESLRIVWGGSARLDQVYSPLYLGDDKTHDIKLQRLFGHVEWRPAPKWVVNAGAMVEHNNLTGTNVSPRLAVNYHFNPQHTIRVGVSEAQRTPTLLEEAANYKVTFNTVGGPYTQQEFLASGGLKPERIFTKEVAYLGDFQNLGLAFDVRVYEDDIRDIIIADNTFTSGYRDFLGGNSLTKQGVETQVRWRYGSTHVSVAHALSQTRDVMGVTASAGRSLLRADPVHTLSALVSHHFPYGIDASIGYYHYSEMWPIGDGDFIKAYGRWDARIAKKLRMGSKQAEIALVGQSLNGTYHDYMWDLTNPNQRNDFKSRIFATVNMEF